MEAARTLTRLPERIRRRRFTDACEELRPLGIAYVLRHFGTALDRADAEDVVADVIIRFHRLEEAGRPPDRLRPAFFQSVRNASVDLLRYRGVRPTAPLEAAAATITEAPGPEEHAESHENVVRLREAMARMRPNYREAIVLRFGLGLTVPEIAERVGISLPAAKKLVLRSTTQIRERMEAIEERSFCPEMREIAERSVLDGELAGVADEDEAAAIRAHLGHCGPCRGFLATLRSNLHELGSAVLLAGIAGGKLGLAARLASHLHSAGDALAHGADRARLVSYRACGALRPEGADSAGLLAGTGQKIAAVCSAGAAGAGACLATGIVGPGIGLAPHHQVAHHPPGPAHVRKAPDAPELPATTYAAPPPAEVPASSSEATVAAAGPKPRGSAPRSEHKVERKAKELKTTAENKATAEPLTASQTAESQFGIESGSPSTPSGSAPAESSAPVAEARTVETAPPSSSSSPSSGSASSKATSTGHDEFGFGG